MLMILKYPKKTPAAEQPGMVRGGGLLIPRPRTLNIAYLGEFEKRFLPKKC